MRLSLHGRSGLALLVGMGSLLSSCALVQSLKQETPEQRLVDALRTEWASPGKPFLDGLVGSDTIGTVKPAGKRTWDVTIPDPSALGGKDNWTLQITRAWILPVHSGQAYAQWLGTRARQLGLQAFLPVDVTRLLSSGQVLAVADVEARFGKTEGAGRSTLDRVAYLKPATTKKGKPRWVLQPRARSPIVLRDALHKVYNDLIGNNERVMTCMGEADISSATHPVQRKCIAKELAHRFGAEAQTEPGG